jgi:2,3-bisphosphoglycerate-dependent phosphoglycerate mutase
MRTLLLARHGLAASNRDGGIASCTAPGQGLTSEGVQEARDLGEALADERIDLGVATELARTAETLELALAGRAVPRLVVPELNEIHFGRFDGGPLLEYRTWAASELPDTPAPGSGESRAMAAARYARGLRVLLARDEATILAVGHALLIRYVVDAAAGLVPAPLITPVPHAVAYRLPVAEIESAAALLEEWSQVPRFRASSNEE